MVDTIRARPYTSDIKVCALRLFYITWDREYYWNQEVKAFVGNNPPDIANPEESLATPLLFELEENDLKSEVDETDVKTPVD